VTTAATYRQATATSPSAERRTKENVRDGNDGGTRSASESRAFAASLPEVGRIEQAWPHRSNAVSTRATLHVSVSRPPL
jgi:hypothetical protein